MRKILFRGKRIDNGEWVYGNLNYGTIEIKSIKDRYYISDFDVNPWDKKFYPVIPESVGQYTGLTDKNGRRIFEGDIVGAKHPEQRKAVPCLVGFGEFEDVDSLDNYNYMGWFLKAYGKCLSILEPGKDEIDLEVIGNIHDNPELMGAHNEST